PHLLGLLLVVAAPQRALAGVSQAAAQRVQVLALVQLPGDPPPVGLIGQVPGGVGALVRNARPTAKWMSVYISCLVVSGVHGARWPWLPG
ncbi:MAG: hypothetical protein ACRDOL_35890, partial [Streptosporangiaceae bacterium]